MVETLETWASESDTKRGVLNHQIEVLTPASLDVKVDVFGGLLLKADLLRTSLQRIVQNIEDVQKLPGAVLVRFGPERVTFMEVQGKITDLVGSRLDPLVMTSGRSMVRESSVWVAETVAAARRKQKGAEKRIQNYQEALKAYSGTVEPVGTVRGSSTPTGAASSGNPPAGQGPPLDQTFIDRIVELSDSNIRFRQQLTESMVEAQLEAVFEDQRASYYERLLKSVSGPSSDGDSTELEARLDEIVKDGKELTKKFNALYEEFSRVALRSSAAMYEARKPVTIVTSQRYARSSLLNLVLVAFAGALLLTFGFFVVRSQFTPERR
jgi:hypothetical protein